jgi:hypothetical protein
VQSPAATNARNHKPDERLQTLDKTDIKPSSCPYDKPGVLTAGADESS